MNITNKVTKKTALLFNSRTKETLVCWETEPQTTAYELYDNKIKKMDGITPLKFETFVSCRIDEGFELIRSKD